MLHQLAKGQCVRLRNDTYPPKVLEEANEQVNLLAARKELDQAADPSLVVEPPHRSELL